MTNLLMALWVWGAGFGVGNVACGVKYKTCKKFTSPGWMYWAKDREVKGQMIAWMGLAVFLAGVTVVVMSRQVYAHGWVYPVLGLVTGVGVGVVMIRREVKLGEIEMRRDAGLDGVGEVPGVIQEKVKAGPGDFQGGSVGVGME
ncbi:MAG: hypothetical protein G01um101416_914 [Microgenomates group bacterium Gr01-1014_16]|nr:MAG: hypothetical protein G01um101416_914 [Microgenomates group bacterium Gr01-1014_16]